MTDRIAPEVTEEMIQAGMAAWVDTFGSPYTRYRAIYKAMRALEPAGISEEAIREIARKYFPLAYGQRECANAIRTALAQRTAPGVGTQAGGPSVCVWSQDDEGSDTYETSCGKAWHLIDGTPTENNVKFCHHCGKPIEESLYDEPTEE